MNGGGDIREEGLRQILLIVAHTRRVGIVSGLFHVHGGTVGTGPFAGMRLMRPASLGDGDLAPKLLGCYEAKLHPAMAKAVARNPKTIVNIGCGEGYYASAWRDCCRRLDRGLNDPGKGWRRGRQTRLQSTVTGPAAGRVRE